MNILVLNASPKGQNSTTVHTALYLQALHPEHNFTFLPVGQQIKRYEADFAPLRSELERAELLLFCYPVYTFIAPYQLHRLIELIKADGVDLSGKFASQITTSKHFYDVTAHRYVEENCFDLGLKVIRGLSADMEDLLSPQGQQEARMFFDQLMFSCQHGGFVTPPAKAPAREKAVYQPCLPQTPKGKRKDVVIVTNCAPEDENLQNMIADFRAALPYESRVVNLRDFPFSGGCLGCFGCAITGKCVYKDGFDDFLRNTIQTTDGFVYAFTISDHYTHSSFKCFDDRQFCNGHRTVTHGTPIAYLISGDYRYESNLRMIMEARSEVGGNYLCGVVTDEGNTAGDLSLIHIFPDQKGVRLHRIAQFDPFRHPLPQILDLSRGGVGVKEVKRSFEAFEGLFHDFLIHCFLPASSSSCRRSSFPLAVTGSSSSFRKEPGII